MNSNHPAAERTMMAIAELLINSGVAGLTEVLKVLFNEVMKMERTEALGAHPYERTEERRGYANGFKPKTLDLRIGQVPLLVPQVRNMEFYPQCLEKGIRSERALKLAVAEMYVNGVSTRKVSEIVKELCGSEVSSTQVSRCAALLDDELEKFRNRPLGQYPYVLFDARYEKVRVDNQVVSVAVLIATGVNIEGKREVLGVSVAISEAEVHWRTFFESLSKRGLHGMKILVSDDHSGLRAARNAVFPQVPWQRCQFHFAQNAQAYAPSKSTREQIGNAVRSIFSRKTIEEARAQVKKVVQQLKDSAPRFTAWLEDNVEECFTIYMLPDPEQKKLRTINGVERVNRELKRRTRVVCIFPNIASLLRLVTALLVEIHEDWTTSDRAYISTTS